MIIVCVRFLLLLLLAFTLRFCISCQHTQTTLWAVWDIYCFFFFFFFLLQTLCSRMSKTEGEVAAQRTKQTNKKREKLQMVAIISLAGVPKGIVLKRARKNSPFPLPSTPGGRKRCGTSFKLNRSSCRSLGLIALNACELTLAVVFTAPFLRFSICILCHPAIRRHRRKSVMQFSYTY